MSRLTSLPDKVIIRVTRYLELRDIIELGKAHKKLCHCIYAQPSVWTKDILFPINDPSITDQFIKQTITKITRNYGILDIRMVNLPLTWFGYFLIFDQFAHSLTSITIQSDHQLFMQLCYHLTRFATDLAILQQDNKIPSGQSIHPTKRSRSPSPRTSTRRHQSSSSFSLPDTS
ncbi:hypothetical protein CU097_008133 [Rhizopus azygosporus]|uniref:F-box domain-containing protein n=1 Tax=Rhizopus azygosporus TaxID=86630 RepID=A0A367JSW3_RHIAZ|nr:hypothetical protein CU097_008133 [Rhizopus azygosporus]